MFPYDFLRNELTNEVFCILNLVKCCTKASVFFVLYRLMLLDYSKGLKLESNFFLDQAKIFLLTKGSHFTIKKETH